MDVTFSLDIEDGRDVDLKECPRSKLQQQCNLMLLMKSFHMSEQIVFWEWISATMLGITTENSVYHWSIE
ncbi:hypothetical protein MKW92_008183, partial [Papaver armeniacum]